MLHARAAESAERAMLATPFVRVRPQSSVLTEAHNQGWATALNLDPRPTIFAQQHSDVYAEPGWLDELIAEMAEHNCGLLSAAVAIKDTRGLTSTTVFDPSARTHRRLTMRELMTLPETFSVEDIPWAPPGSLLLTNTGLWACRFDGDWVENICFTIRDFITRRPGGSYEVGFWPEDWQFAMDAARLGVRVMATRKVRVEHFGFFPFKNDRAWGTDEHDSWWRLPGEEASAPEADHLGGYRVGGDPRTWAPEAWEALLAHYKPSTVVDVGSGEGHSAKWFADRGLEVLALDGDTRAVEQCRAKGLRAIQVDFEKHRPSVKPHDLAWCAEVVEHVSEDNSENLLGVLGECGVVAMTHAQPSDLGHHHVNCRPAEYWIAKMSRRGYRCNEALTTSLREATTAEFVKRTLLVFERAA